MKKIHIVLSDEMSVLINYFYEKGYFEEWSKSKIINYLVYMGCKQMLNDFKQYPDHAESVKKFEEFTQNLSF